MIATHIYDIRYRVLEIYQIFLDGEQRNLNDHNRIGIVQKHATDLCNISQSEVTLTDNEHCHYLYIKQYVKHWLNFRKLNDIVIKYCEMSGLNINGAIKLGIDGSATRTAPTYGGRKSSVSHHHIAF
ncbi:hypothetical protein LOAG_03924 [Loa loa]|uniref:Uncharacterized protein n=1 Tax=Loa loa TaxID=7209 RepID=A0A1S0U3B0_LOALO|nr:hypothetical protein LOAG_03924 [Loa loa]EFO24557.1 hypothetical protein LOAG_03924 [Loa loa]